MISTSRIPRALCFLLLAACAFSASGCKKRSPIATPTEENTMPIPNPQPQQPQPQPQEEPQPGKPGRGAGKATINEDLLVTLSTDKTTYRRGETVAFTIRLRNLSGQARPLIFTSGKNFDLSARRVGGDAPAPEVWRWGMDKIFAQNISEVSLRPGEELSFSATWEQVGNDGAALGRGSYLITPEIAARPRLLGAPLALELNN